MGFESRSARGEGRIARQGVMDFDARSARRGEEQPHPNPPHLQGQQMERERLVSQGMMDFDDRSARGEGFWRGEACLAPTRGKDWRNTMPGPRGRGGKEGFLFLKLLRENYFRKQNRRAIILEAKMQNAPSRKR